MRGLALGAASQQPSSARRPARPSPRRHPLNPPHIDPWLPPQENLGEKAKHAAQDAGQAIR